MTEPAIDGVTPQQQTLIGRIAARLRDEPRVEAAWLSGGLGKGIGDAFSDVDVLVLVGDGQAGAVSADLAKGMGAIANPVLVNSLYGGRLLNVVTEDWERFDLSFAEGPELGLIDGTSLQVLFNRGERAPLPHPAAPYVTTPAALLKLVEEFLRVSGLAPVGAGRGDHVLMLAGVDLLRTMTIELMLEENGASPAARGGMMRRNSLLTAVQVAALEAAPPLVAARESVLAGNMYFAGLFLPRARALAGKIGMAWPTALEDAARRHLRRALGVELPARA